MARKPNRVLRPMRELNSKQQSERRFARKAGFKNEYVYRAWMKKWSSIPQNDPRWMQSNLRGEQRLREIKRLKRVIRRVSTPAKIIQWKYQKLVLDLHKLSPFVFQVKYEAEIRALLQDPNTTEAEKRMLRRIQKDLQRGFTVPHDMQPGEQGELF